MKATIDIPDELYRRVKAKSALQGRPVRAVAIELFQHWLDQDIASRPQPTEQLSEESDESVEARRRATQEWLDNWLKMGEEAFKNAPPGPSAREILDADRSRLERR